MNSFLTVKVDKCGESKHDTISRKLFKAQQKVRGMLDAEFMKWLFVSALLSFRFQLRYYRMNNNSKLDNLFLR